MSPTRRQLFTGLTSMLAAGAVAGVATADADDRPHPHSFGRHQESLASAQTATSGAWSGAALNALCKELATQVIETTRQLVPEEDQNTVLSGTASLLMADVLAHPGDLLAAHWEPEGSVVGAVIHQYMAMSPGLRDMHDATMAGESFLEYTRDCREAKRTTNRNPAVLALTDSSMNFAGEMGMIGCRIGAHLAVANMNAFGNHHASEQMRYRRQLADTFIRIDEGK
jgi:hypothetical protein